MLSLLLILPTLAVASAANVLPLDESSFDTTVGGSRPVFAEFFAPWCGHCKKLAPEYEVFATAFASDPVDIISVDCDAHAALCQRFGIRGYPSLRYFPSGSTEPEEYSGGRSAADLIKFINGKVGLRRGAGGDSAVQALDESNFEDVVIKSQKFAFVEFFAPWCGHCKTLAPEYEIVAKAFKNEPSVVIASVDADAHKALGTKYGVTGFPTLKLFTAESNGEGIPYSGGRTAKDIVDYINKAAGTSRGVDGQLHDKAGVLEDLTSLVKGFLSSSKDKMAAAISQVEAKVEAGVEGASVYAKSMQRIASKGADYVVSEIARLERLLEGKVSAAKKDAFKIRINILKHILDEDEE